MTSSHCHLLNSTKNIVLISLVLSAAAIAGSLLILPSLLQDLEQLSQWVIDENKKFKVQTDDLWHELMHLQGRRNNIFEQRIPRRSRRQTSMEVTAAKFLENLERSFSSVFLYVIHTVIRQFQNRSKAGKGWL
jgi:predicted PurR-regulated permease PerM